MSEWISASQAAKILGVSVRTVQRSLSDPDERHRQWEADGRRGWRLKPLARRDEYQVHRAWVRAMARGEPPPDEQRPAAGSG